MTYFRSELMSFYQIILQSEFAYDYISQLGDLGCVKFCEKQPALNASTSTLNITPRKFNGELLLCNEIEKRLFAIHDVLKQEKIPLLDVFDGVKVEAPSMKEINEIDTFTKKVQEEMDKVWLSFD